MPKKDTYRRFEIHSVVAKENMCSVKREDCVYSSRFLKEQQNTSLRFGLDAQTLNVQAHRHVYMMLITL